jgi:hypothetical protein
LNVINSSRPPDVQYTTPTPAASAAESR